MVPYVLTPERGHWHWAQTPYLPEPPLDVLGRGPKSEVRVGLTFKTRPVLW
jgi:hypothetical protein